MSLLSSSDAAAVEQTCAAHAITVQEFNTMRATAIEGKTFAYCPYSKFRVGAGVLTASGRVVRGANVENASYPVGTCAERTALGTVVVDGEGKGIRAIAVSTDISPPASPCGMCRQFIREFCDSHVPIIMFDKNNDFCVMTVEQLLPMSFGPDKLPPPGAPGTM